MKIFNKHCLVANASALNLISLGNIRATFNACRTDVSGTKE